MTKRIIKRILPIGILSTAYEKRKSDFRFLLLAFLVLSLCTLTNRAAFAYIYDPDLPAITTAVSVAAEEGSTTGPAPVTFTPGDNEDTSSTTYAGMQFQATAGNTPDNNSFQQVEVQGTASQPALNLYTSIRSTFPFLVEAPSTVPANSPVTIDITFTLSVGSSTVSRSSTGSEASAYLQDPSNNLYGIGAGWDYNGPYTYNSSTGLYTETVTLTETDSVLSDVYNDIRVNTTVLTFAQIGMANNAFAYADPVITIDPSTPDWQDYQIAVNWPQYVAPVPEPSSLGLVGVGGVGLVGMLILRRRRGVR